MGYPLWWWLQFFIFMGNYVKILLVKKMKKIILQKNLFIYINVLSLIMFCFSIIGALVLDIEILYCLFISLFFTLFSLLFLINKIEYNDKIIKFKLVLKKLEANYDEIKEVYISNRGILGSIVVFNFSCETDDIPINYLDYIKKCNGLNCLYINGINNNDLNGLLKFYKGKIIR